MFPVSAANYVTFLDSPFTTAAYTTIAHTMDVPQQTKIQAASASAPAPACPANRGPAMEFIQEAQVAFPPPQIASTTRLTHRQTRFQTSQRPELFQRFLQVFMESISPASRDIASKTAEDLARPVHEKMREIFKDDLDLLGKFESFLPGAKKEASASTQDQDLAAELDAEEVD